MEWIRTGASKKRQFGPMDGQLTFFFLFLLIGDYNCQMNNHLKDRQLRILPIEVVPSLALIRNSSGHIVQMKGFSVQVLTWLSEYFKFTYEIVDIAPGIVFDDSKVGPGWKYRTLNGEVDMAVGPLGLVGSRQAFLDYSYPYRVAYYYLMIPAPQLANNFAAPWKPFSINIWILLFSAIVIIVLALSFISRMASRQAPDVPCDRNVSNFSKMNRSTDYIIQVLLSQGGCCLTQKSSIRLLAAGWCLAAFVLVNSYNSTLISFVSTTNREPIIKHLNEMPDTPHLTVCTNYGWTADAILLTEDSGIFHYLGTLLKNDPSLRCNTTKLCVDKVLQGYSGFMTVREPILTVMEDDVRATGECRLSIMKEQILPQLIGFAFPKHSPHRQLIGNQILRLWETGLPLHWNIKVPGVLEKCFNSEKKPVKSPLTLKQISSAFIIRICGYGLAFMLLLIENVSHYRTLIDLFHVRCSDN